MFWLRRSEKKITRFKIIFGPRWFPPLGGQKAIDMRLANEVTASESLKRWLKISPPVFLLLLSPTLKHRCSAEANESLETQSQGRESQTWTWRWQTCAQQQSRGWFTIGASVRHFTKGKANDCYPPLRNTAIRPTTSSHSIAMTLLMLRKLRLHPGLEEAQHSAGTDTQKPAMLLQTEEKRGENQCD